MREVSNGGGAGSESDVSSSENHHQKYSDGVDSMDGAPSTHRRLSDMEEAVLEQKRKDLADLAVWLSGLNATNLPLDDYASLTTGRAFAELLFEIDKSFFTEKWLETFSSYSRSATLVVKRTMMKKLWRKMSDYISENTSRRLPDENPWSDVAERIDGIEERDLPVVVDFASLIVGLAHIGKEAKRFVEYSQSLKSQEVLATIARLIQKVMEELPEETTYLEVSKLDEDTGGKDDMRELCTQESTSNGHSARRRTSSGSSILEAQLDAYRKEKDQLQQEVERLTKALDAALLNTAASSESNDVSLLESQNAELKTKRREAEERVHELEAQLEQQRSSLEELTIENDKFKSEQKDLLLMRNTLLSSQDEVVEWREKATQMSIDAELLKKREKEVKDLQAQVKTLNTRIEHHVKQSTLDEEYKEAAKKLRQQIGQLKALNEELDVKLISKELRQNDLEAQLIQQKEKVKALEDRKEELTHERNGLQERLHLKESITPRSLHESMFEGGNLSFDENVKLPPEIEVQRLQERIAELEALEPLQGEIISLKKRCGSLEEEIMVMQKQRDDLLAEVAQLREKEEASQKTNVSDDYLEMKVQLEKATVEVESLKEVGKLAEGRIATLDELLKTRTAECEKNQELLQKAKHIIDVQDQGSQPVGEDNGTSVQQFKTLQAENEQLRQKVEKLEIELHTVSTGMEEENRLITGAAYHMVSDRSVDGVMGMRAAAGADSENARPPTLLETQKMSGALPWRLSTDITSSFRHNSLQTAFLCLISLLAVLFFTMLFKMLSAMNAPPIA